MPSRFKADDSHVQSAVTMPPLINTAASSSRAGLLLGQCFGLYDAPETRSRTILGLSFILLARIRRNQLPSSSFDTPYIIGYQLQEHSPRTSPNTRRHHDTVVIFRSEGPEPD